MNNQPKFSSIWWPGLSRGNLQRWNGEHRRMMISHRPPANYLRLHYYSFKYAPPCLPYVWLMTADWDSSKSTNNVLSRRTCVKDDSSSCIFAHAILQGLRPPAACHSMPPCHHRHAASLEHTPVVHLREMASVNHRPIELLVSIP